MSDAHTNRNMLLGILALQMDFITRDQLIAGMHAWVPDKTRKLDEILLEQGALPQDMRTLLTALVDKHLEVHEGDAEKSLASLSSIGSLREDLKPIADPEIAATLTIASANRGDDPGAKGSFSVGASTSAGTRFRILRPYAKGGLGAVSVAQDDELNREVALKEIQERFSDDDNSRSRFVLEAEVTGGLEHPGIVPVYGLGQYADGRPFYAMRFIRGDSLQEAADSFHRAEQPNESERSLELRKLLGRFVDVCQAIEYAHSRGVLHRDLKPGNIMLGKYGETLVVDWGLAKLKGRDDAKVEGEATLTPRSGSGSTPTQMGSAIGTPAYMPPEQAAGRLDELGPASDVYSLGGTLYFLLTGRKPIEGETIGEVLKQAQTGGFAPPRTIKQDIPRALESVCLRAMATRPEARYASPQALADDIERFLADEPTAAHSEPLVVRTRRWMRKHPKSVAALAATLSVGLASTILIAAVVSAKNQELAAANTDLDLANTQLTQKNIELEEANEAERLAKEEAETRRQESEAVLQFFQDRVLAAARPEDQEGGLGINATIRAAVDAAEPQIEDSFADQPLVEASIREALGSTYRYLGEAQLAIQQHDHARQIRRSRLGSGHRDTLLSMNNLALAYQDAGRPDKALPIHEETLSLMKQNFGPDHPDTLISMNNVAEAYRHAGRLDEAMSIQESTLKLRKEKLGPDHPHTLSSMNNLAQVHEDAGRMDTALPIYEETLKLITQKLGAEHFDTLAVMGNLAMAYLKAKQPKKALPLFDQFIATRRRLAEADDPQFDGVLARVSLALLQYQQYLAAETYLRECLRIRERTTADHWLLFNTQSMLGGALAGQGKVILASDKEAAQKMFTEAEPLLIDSYEGMKQREDAIPDVGKIRLTEALQRLVNLYTAWDKPHEAAKWQAELDKRQAEAKKLEAVTEKKEDTVEKPKQSKPQVDGPPGSNATEGEEGSVS